ncbi:hypothetical protein phiAS5_ORF0122 [Aeromonas phage phiAS5]|uniref:Uncharacterized protein n=1 Tax=Aeromonas phage phiAS5 TaxID=879630 RepID=E1A2L9_9CAUD|nr:hypothetical protein phiAS5_ORF0122 [Aeromonas phage phiAS5]ADM79965.1 hypothetical protein phiAS5_ORF0122 [Aeromonas phage phiAS5]BES53263.1 hypothetical protein [Aeromonas phage phiWae14]
MMLATRLNRAMKQEQVEWHSLCRVFGLLGILIVAANVFAMLLGEPTEWVLGLKIWGSMFMFGAYVKTYTIEANRIQTVGNKFKHILIFDYLCRKSGNGATEIADFAAEKFDRLSKDERKKIERQLNIQLLTFFVIVATILVFID